jgi:hypothetical protein
VISGVTATARCSSSTTSAWTSRTGAVGSRRVCWATLPRFAGERAIRVGFVLTEASNEAAMALYDSAGGVRPNDDDVMWDFDYAAD